MVLAPRLWLQGAELTITSGSGSWKQAAFWAEFQRFGERPAGYHLVNLGLHAANALLLWRTLAVLGAPAAWWAAALFAVHPIQVETVGWISEQKNLLSTLFSLGAILGWERFSRRGDSRRARLRRCYLPARRLS